MTKKVDLKQSLQELQEITDWFQGEDVDLDEGLEKLRAGVTLIKECKTKIKNIENEFIDIKKELIEGDIKEDSNKSLENENEDNIDFDELLGSLN
jgi:exodeoxyribonuclease VII small subunit